MKEKTLFPNLSLAFSATISHRDLDTTTVIVHFFANRMVV